MDRRNNPRNGGRSFGGPHGRPTPPPTYRQLQDQLNSAHEYIDELKMKVHSLEEFKSQSLVEREKFCHMVPKKKVQVGRLEELLNNRAINYRVEICHLKQSLQLQQDKYDEMVARYEAEKPKVSDPNIQKVETEVLLIESQRKVSQMEEQIHQRDTEILESLSQTLAEKTNQPNSKAGELQQSEITWPAKCAALKDRFTKDLDEKEKSWETRFNALQTMHNSLQENLKTEQAENKDWQKKGKQMEEDKKELEDLCLKMNEKRRGFLFNKKAGDRQAELEKMKSKMSQKEMKKTGKIEKAEKKKKEAKMDKEKEEKVEKGFFSWMNRKKCNEAE